MLQKIQKYIEEWNMINAGDKLLVGISGGADSVCLLLVLCALYKEKDITLEAVHVEHGIRGEESRQDAFFVKNLCDKWKIPCEIVSVDVPAYSRSKGLGFEEAARILRYEVFAEIAKEKGAKVVLAHHMEDNAETVLFQMLRGSSLTGLCGMQPIRKDAEEVCYIRPFLAVHRKEIEEFLLLQSEKYCTDSTNKELEYSRNYVRNIVVPALEKVNAQAVSHINETAAKLSEIRSFMDFEMEKYWTECAVQNDVGICLDIEKLLALHIVLQKEMIYRAIAETAGSKKDIHTVHVESVRNLCKNQSGKELYLPYGIRVKKEYQKLLFISKEHQMQSSTVKENYFIEPADLKLCMEQNLTMPVNMGDDGEKIFIRVFSIEEGKNLEFPKNSYTKWMDYDKIKQGFCIRTRKSGDYFICDEYGHHKKLKQYFTDAKIPAAQREQMWLLTQESLVLWAIGGRMSEHTKITTDTKNVVEIIYQGGK